jgi:hypothetical protein
MSKGTEEVGGIGRPENGEGISLKDAAKAAVDFERKHQIVVPVGKNTASKLEI